MSRSALLFAGEVWGEELDDAEVHPGLPAPTPAATEPVPATAPQTKRQHPRRRLRRSFPLRPTTELTAVDDNKKLVTPWALPADRVAEMDVYAQNGKKIGEVDAVLQDKKGEIKGVAALVHGGFLGFGSKRS